MRLASGCALMVFWSAVCVGAPDRPSLNSSSDEDIHTNTSPCFIQIGDVPYTKCDIDPGSDDVFTSRPETDTIPNRQSSAVTESVPTTVFTTAINPTSTTTAITPTVHPSPNSPDETKITTKTPTQSPTIVSETVHKNHEDGRNATESTNCVSVRMGINTEVYLLVVCGVLMLIMAILSFCLYKQCKKQPVENPNLTRLISIPNPAFSNA